MPSNPNDTPSVRSRRVFAHHSAPNKSEHGDLLAQRQHETRTVANLPDTQCVHSDVNYYVCLGIFATCENHSINLG